MDGFDSIPSNIDGVFSVNPSANAFLFGDFNVHHKDWVTYSGGTGRPGKFYYNFSISSDLTQMVKVPTRMPDCDSHSSAVLDLCLFSDASICSSMIFSPLGNSDHVVVSVFIDFPANSKRFIAQLMAILVLIKMVISEMFHGKISLNSVLLLLLENFVKKIS